uniref:Uncharacterized protein n=1 Tax=Brassica oleracea var. oleracea TaxID=109376 RepID=A0A0D3BAE9_BRAOL
MATKLIVLCCFLTYALAMAAALSEGDSPVARKFGGEDGPREEAEAPEILNSEETVRRGHHHSTVDRSVAGGGVILGGLATTFLVVVFCYLRATRKHKPNFADETGTPKFNSSFIIAHFSFLAKRLFLPNSEVFLHCLRIHSGADPCNSQDQNCIRFSSPLVSMTTWIGSIYEQADIRNLKTEDQDAFLLTLAKSVFLKVVRCHLEHASAIAKASLMSSSSFW